MKILSSITHPSCFKPVWISFFCWTQDILKNVGNHSWWNNMGLTSKHQLFGYRHSSKHHPLCSAEERNLYWFETTWGWVNWWQKFHLKMNYSFKYWLKFVYLFVLTDNLPFLLGVNHCNWIIESGRWIQEIDSWSFNHSFRNSQWLYELNQLIHWRY